MPRRRRLGLIMRRVRLALLALLVQLMLLVLLVSTTSTSHAMTGTDAQLAVSTQHVNCVLGNAA